MPLTEDERLELQEDLMRADLKLKDRQFLWETPKGIAAIAAAIAVTIGALTGLAGGFIGYQIGVRPPAPGPTIIFQPGSIVVPQAALQK